MKIQSRSVQGRPGEEVDPNRIGKSAIDYCWYNTDSQLLNLDDSIPGIAVKYAKDLSVLDFAPGARPIRLVMFSQNALDELKVT